MTEQPTIHSESKGNKILELKSITAGYNGQIVLRDVNLSVFETDFIGIIGANGSGKTTLLKIILGLIRPLRGRIHYYFADRDKVKKSIGYLPQAVLLDDKFPITVKDMVISGLTAKTGPFKHFSKHQRGMVDTVMEQMGIHDIKTKAIGELSGGQMQRVLLARALISSPRLLILDEPSTFVDKGFEKNLFEILEELNRKMAILMVSHDLGMISSHVKSIACISHTLHYHVSSEITQELLDNYSCPIDLITHGTLPHRVLKIHESKPSVDKLFQKKRRDD